MSIRQTGHFYFRPKDVKPFLCQYLIFFSDFFFTLEISFGSVFQPKIRNLTKIADLKVYGNLNSNTVFPVVTPGGVQGMGGAPVGT